MQPWALVSPSSRGIGLEFVRQLLRTTNIPVVATARKDLDRTRENVLSGLKDVKEDRLHVVKVDVLDEQITADAAEQVAKVFPPKENYLHLSLCIPGILFPEKSTSQIDYANAELTFRTNALGPLLLLKHFSPFLPKKATKLTSDTRGLPKTAIWANMSARVGSISDNAKGGWYSYRSSKAAVNQITKSFDNYLQATSDDKSLCISMHPGTVKTGLSKEFWSTVKEDQLFSPEHSVSQLLEMLASRGLEHRGKCWDYKSEEILP